MISIARNDKADLFCSYAIKTCNIFPSLSYKSITAAKNIIPPHYPNNLTFLEVSIPESVPETERNNVIERVNQILTGTATIQCDVKMNSNATNNDFHFLISTVSKNKNPLFIFKPLNSNPFRYVLSAEVIATENGHVSEPVEGTTSDNTENIFIL